MSSQKTMQALVLRQDGYDSEALGVDLSDLAQYLALETRPVPEPGPDEILVRMVRAAVNPSDAAHIKGVYRRPRVKGAVAGFEGFGVIASGAGEPGQRVNVTRSPEGSWAEYVCLPAASAIPLRPDLRDEDAAALVVNPMSAAAMGRLVQADGAPSFVVNAAGSQLGRMLLAYGAEVGIPAVAIVRHADVREQLRDIGAAEVLVSSNPDFRTHLRAALKTHAPRVLLDAVGDQIAADTFFAMPDEARWINYGKLSTEAPVLTELPQLLFRNKRIEGFWLSQWFAETPVETITSVFQDVQARLAGGRWRTDVRESVPIDRVLSDLPDAYATRGGKVQITFS